MANAKHIVKISVYRDKALVEEATFDREQVLLGSFARADVRLDDDVVERRHATVWLTPGGDLSVENLAGNGRLTLNGAPVDGRVSLPNGAELGVGPYRVIVSVLDPADILDKHLPPGAAPSRPKGGTPALEVAMFWEGTLLAVNHFTKAAAIRIGEHKDCEYFAPEEVIRAKSVNLVVPYQGKFAVDFSVPGLDGNVRIREKVYALAELKAANLLAEGRFLVVDETTRCRLRVGTISFLVSHAYLPPKPKTALFARVNFHEHIYIAISLIAHVLFMTILSLIPEEQLQGQRDPHRARAKSFQVLKMVQEEKQDPEKEEEKKPEEEEKKESDETKAETEATERKEEVRETKQPKPTETSRRPTDELQTNLQPHRQREYNRRVALSTGVHKAFDQQTDLVQQMMSGGTGTWGTGSRGLKVLMSKGAGGQAAGGFFTGSGGLDPFGGMGGEGGGGGFRGTALAGTLGDGAARETEIAGLGKEESDGRGDGQARLRDRAPKGVVTVATPTMTGGLDRETVQRYIRSKLGQIQWCYRNELQRDPSLTGKVTVEFVIAPTGSVMRPSIAATTMNNSKVEECIREKVAMWRFPPPKDGGAAVVRYPFIFKSR